MNYVYLDEAASTKVDERVKDEMEVYFTERYGNPSSIHRKGREAAEACEVARSRIASILGAEDEEILFTSGGTEADNLAIKGAVFQNDIGDGHIITTEIEHAAVYETCKYLEELGYSVTYLDVDEDGMVDPSEFEAAIRPDTVVASIIYANNEIGTIQPIKELAEIADEYDVLFHTDAVQAVGKVPIDVKKEKIDMLSLSSHKIHGPKGVGALYKSDDIELVPIMHGGGHEDGVRSGTLNVPGIVGLGKACQLAEEEMDDYIPEMLRLRDRIIDGVLERVDECRLNGHPERRLPHNANFFIKAVEGEAMVLQLDSNGIASSTGSACSSKDLNASRVLLATGMEESKAHCSLRFSLSKYTTDEDVDRLLEVLPEVIDNLREMSPLWEG